MSRLIGAIDQGTTSTRFLIVDEFGALRAIDQREHRQITPGPGQVEHDAAEIWTNTLGVIRGALAKAGLTARDLSAIGLANQRETTVLWDRRTGAPLHPALVWMDTRTRPLIKRLTAQGAGDLLRARTGLPPATYFSASKLACWLISHLTGGRVHATDATNASRTLIYNIASGEWDTGICDLLGIPLSLLPEVKDCAAPFGMTRPDLFGREIPILGVAGDQQAATVGQACFSAGMMKSTYGTGCFALLNTGADMVPSKNRLLTTVAYQLNGKPTYALEGSIFIAGAVVQWLRDGLKMIREAKETHPLAEAAEEAQGVILVPAFTGLGAPYWRPDCRGAIYGLTRNSGPAELARAALESVGFQTRDLLEAMRADWGASADGVLRVDGGMTASDWTMQFLADILGAPVDRPKVTETTALGAAYLAAMQAGMVGGPAEFAKNWALDRRFTPAMAPDLREGKYARWKRAVTATMSF